MLAQKCPNKAFLVAILDMIVSSGSFAIDKYEGADFNYGKF